MGSGTPGVPQTNGLAERFARTAKEGTRCNLMQGGIRKSGRERASEAFCFARNTENGACHARFGEDPPSLASAVWDAGRLYANPDSE